MKKTLSGVFIVLFFTGLVIGLHYLIFHLLRSNGSFNVKTITVKGEQLVHRNEIIRASGIRPGVYLFDIDLKQSAASIRNLDMVRTAQVKRIPPHSIEIEVRERAVIAMVRDSTRYYTADEEGYVLPHHGDQGLPLISTDFPVLVSRGRIQEQFVRVALKNLHDFEHRDGISQIVFKRQEGVFITLKGMNTVFYLGNKLADQDFLNLVYSLGKVIKEKKLKIKYVDVNKENPFGIYE